VEIFKVNTSVCFVPEWQIIKPCTVKVAEIVTEKCVTVAG
jgi:hypothetical protein